MARASELQNMDPSGRYFCAPWTTASRPETPKVRLTTPGRNALPIYFDLLEVALLINFAKERADFRRVRCVIRWENPFKGGSGAFPTGNVAGSDLSQ
jgi:hypothetical protein